ncbi:MAG: hypothetical protein ACYSR8_12595 [Planctomycetota bacterium]
MTTEQLPVNIGGDTKSGRDCETQMQQLHQGNGLAPHDGPAALVRLV